MVDQYILKAQIKNLWLNGFLAGYSAGMATAITIAFLVDTYVTRKPSGISDSIASALNGRR